tara:strand:+ start:698 stop:1192 length:495 start_codon:yes stop_codon:yes gene_type:complete
MPTFVRQNQKTLNMKKIKNIKEGEVSDDKQKLKIIQLFKDSLNKKISYISKRTGKKIEYDAIEWEWEFDDYEVELRLENDNDTMFVVRCSLEGWQVDRGDYHYYYSDGMQRDYHEHMVDIDRDNAYDEDISTEDVLDHIDEVIKNTGDKGWLGLDNIKIEIVCQ